MTNEQDLRRAADLLGQIEVRVVRMERAILALLDACEEAENHYSIHAGNASLAHLSTGTVRRLISAAGEGGAS